MASSTMATAWCRRIKGFAGEEPEAVHSQSCSCRELGKADKKRQSGGWRLEIDRIVSSWRMAGGSKSKAVREWMRKRMAPRRKKAAAGGGESSGSSDPSTPASAPSSPGRKLLAGGLPSALRWKKPRGNVLAALFQRAAYHLLWFVESVVVVAQLIFFFVRFGFKL